MTLSQFLLGLRKFKGQFKIDNLGCLRVILPDYPAKPNGEDYPCCPITAMLWLLRVEANFNACFEQSAKKLGLHDDNAQLIVICADHPEYNLLRRPQDSRWSRLTTKMTKVMLRVLDLQLPTA